MDGKLTAGFDVWCVDLLGYGRSDRLPEMDMLADQHAPLVDTAQAERDVSPVIDFMLGVTGSNQTWLIGYSRGTIILAAARPMSSTVWFCMCVRVKVTPSAITAGGPPGAYREVTVEAMLARWVTGLDAAQQTAIGDLTARQQWAATVLASDPNPSSKTLRAPAGVVKDVLENWGQGRPTYDPAKIQAPTLIVVGEWDHETTPEQGREVFARLKPYDRRFADREQHTLCCLNDRRRSCEPRWRPFERVEQTTMTTTIYQAKHIITMNPSQPDNPCSRARWAYSGAGSLTNWPVGAITPWTSICGPCSDAGA